MLDDLGIEIVGESEENFQCLCPFHANSSTPAFTISKTEGLFLCFSPECGEKGNLIQLIKRVKNCSYYDAKRYIYQYEGEVDVVAQITKALEHKPIEPFDPALIQRMYDNFVGSPGEDYMLGRGFTEETLDKFQIGYSFNKGLVTVPMHDFRGTPVGVIGRTIEGKRFQNSKRLPSSKTLWNLHRAKAAGSSTAIVVEASFDGMMIDQAGYPNVVATLKGHISKYQVDYLQKYFTETLMFADNDGGPGYQLGLEVKEKSRMPMRWANWEYYEGLKDATDLKEDRIRDAIRNSIPHAEMLEIAGNLGYNG